MKLLHPRHEVVERHVNIMSKAASQTTLLEKKGFRKRHLPITTLI